MGESSNSDDLPTMSFAADPKSTKDDLERTLDPKSTRDDLEQTLDSDNAANQVGSRDDDFSISTFGNYEILEELARGGMGIVYKARQIGADRVVALKVIRDNDPQKEEVERFLVEARAAANLDHPNIVPVYEVGELNGCPFFSMKLVAGQSLNKLLDRKPIESKRAAEIVEASSRAIAFAHEEGIIHRDVKPANIIVDPSGSPHVTDFGLAKVVGSAIELTRDGQIVGTPAYMPPEQALGDRGKIGPLSDVYSLGAVLYACLTGRPPFQAASIMATINQLMKKEPVPPSQLNADVDQDLETICLKCLSKEPASRYGSAGELASDLSRYLNGQPILARPVSTFERARKWAIRNPVVTALSALTALALLVTLVGGAMYQYRLTEALGLAEKESDRAVKSEAERTDLLYQSLVDQAEALNQMRPPGYGKKVFEAIKVARGLDSPLRDLKELRQLLVNGLGFAGYNPPTELEELPRALTAFEVTPDEKQIMIGTANGDVLIYDRFTGERKNLFECHAFPVANICFVDDKNAITHSVYCHEVKEWHRSSKGWEPTVDLASTTPEGCTDLKITFDGRYVLGLTNFGPEVRPRLTSTDILLSRYITPKASRSFFYLRPLNFVGPEENGFAKITDVRAVKNSDFRNYRLATYYQKESERVGRIEIYDFRTQTITRKIEIEEEDVLGLAINHSGSHLVYHSNAGAFTIDLRTGKVVRRLVDFPVIETSFVGRTSNVRLRSRTKEMFISAIGSDKPIESAVTEREGALYCPRTGDRFLLSNNNQSISVSQFVSAECQQIIADPEIAFDVSFTANEDLIVCGREHSNRLQFWNRKNGEKLLELDAIRGRVSPDGKWIALSRYGELSIVDSVSLEKLASFENTRMINRLEFSPDGKYLLGYGWDKENVGVFQIERKGERIQLNEIPIEFGKDVGSAGWLSGNRLAWIRKSSNKASNQVFVSSLTGDGKPEPVGKPIASPNYCSLAAKGDTLFVLSQTNQIEKWSLENPGSNLTSEGSGYIRPISLSPNGKYAIVNHSVVEAGSLKSVFEFPSFGDRAWSCDWSLNGRYIALGYSNGMIAIWDMKEVNRRLKDLDFAQVDFRSAKKFDAPELTQFVEINSKRDSVYVKLQSLSEFKENREELSASFSFTELTEKLQELSFRGANNPTEVQELMVEICRKFPVERHEALIELRHCLVGFSEPNNPDSSQEAYDIRMKLAVETLQELESESDLFKFCASIVYLKYGHPRSIGRLAKSKEEAEEFQIKSFRLMNLLVEKGFVERAGYGDRWFWISNNFANLMKQRGNKKEFLKGLESCVNYVDEIGFDKTNRFYLLAKKQLDQMNQ